MSIKAKRYAPVAWIPAGFWAAIVAVMMLVVAAGLSADIINKELKEIPPCTIEVA